MKLDFYSDPSHGWLKVPMKTFLKYSTKDIRGAISHFSYMSKNSIFLEEDRDASLFLNRLKDMGISFTFREHMSNKQSRIRSYERYTTKFTCNMPATI